VNQRLIVAALWLLTGCGSLNLDHVVTGMPVAPHAGPVRVMMEAEPVPPDFQEIAIVRARGVGNQANLQAVVGGLQREASSLGGNAVVRVRIDQGAGSISAIGTAGVLP
jgi:hypothetical protein